MLQRKHKRLIFISILFGVAAFAVAQVLFSLEDAVVFFRTPTEIASQSYQSSKRLRVGGLVEEGSVARQADGAVAFRVTDLNTAVPVSFRGLLPDLFREGQGVVVEGKLVNGTFVADQVLAKHDERYMPPEVADALKKSGQWQHMEQSMRQAGQLPPADSAK